MFKKIISLFTAICMIFMLWDIPFTASAETDGEFEYKIIEGNEIQIRDYKGSSAEVVIPETIDGKPVTTIYELNGNTVTKVTIPKTVKTIYGAAFLTPNLTEVCFDGFSEGFVIVGTRAFPDSVTKIVFPANMTDQDIRLKMTLTVFPSGAALYSGAEPLPHAYEYMPCDDGQHYQKCTACGQIKENSYEDHIGEGDFIIDPTYNNETNHYQKCKCGMVIGDLHVWDDGTVTTEPTEETEGVMTYICTVCSKTKTDSIDRLEHTHTLTPHEAVAAACTTGGNKAYWTCLGCDKIFADENGTTEIDEIPTIPALEHQEEEISAVPPTCTATGLTAGVRCSVCDTVLTAPQLIPANGHSLDSGMVTTEPTCTEKGEKTFSCKNCGYTETAEISALGHNYVNGKCSVCQEVDPNHICTGGTATCIQRAICTICGNEYGDFAEHNYVDGECTRCHSADPDYTPPVTEPTVTEPTVTEPTVTEPTVTEPTVTEPTVTEPAVTEPTVTEPTVTAPPVTEPVITTAPVYPSYTPAYSTPPMTTSALSKEPYISGASGKIGWEAISDDIMSTPDGGVITVNMNGTAKLPKNIVSDISGRDIDLVLIMNGGFVWTINGMSVTKAKTVDMSVRKISKIPKSTVQEYFGDVKTVQLDLRHSGDFGFIAELTIDLGSRYSGMYTNSYCYKSRKFEFGDSSEIVDGQAKLWFAHASSWLITVESSPVFEDVSSAAAAHSSDTPIDMSSSASGKNLPDFIDEKKSGFSNRKRRYRILKKRRLDDLVFVF